MVGGHPYQRLRGAPGTLVSLTTFLIVSVVCMCMCVCVCVLFCLFTIFSFLGDFLGVGIGEQKKPSELMRLIGEVIVLSF